MDLVTGTKPLLASFLLLGHFIIQSLTKFNILLIESVVQLEISVAGKGETNQVENLVSI